MRTYKLIHDQKELENFIKFLPELNSNEGYFLILIARRKWYESDIASATKLKRETVNKNKIIKTILQWEVMDGLYTSNDKPIHQNNLGVYISYNPKDQYAACFELINQCLDKIKNNRMDINIKSLANDVIQGCNGTKNFIDIDVDIKENENYLDIVKFIKSVPLEIAFPPPIAEVSVIDEKYLTFIKTNGGFHCLIRLLDNSNNLISPDYGNKWYQTLKNHPFKSELNIMSNDLMPLPGCNQGQFVPYTFYPFVQEF